MQNGSDSVQNRRPLRRAPSARTPNTCCCASLMSVRGWVAAVVAKMILEAATQDQDRAAFASFAAAACVALAVVAMQEMPLEGLVGPVAGYHDSLVPGACALPSRAAAALLSTHGPIQPHEQSERYGVLL